MIGAAPKLGLDVPRVRSRRYRFPMDVFIGHESALAYWRGASLDEPLHASRVSPKPGNVVSAEDAARAMDAHPAFRPGPLDILVASPADRRRSKMARARIWSMTGSPASFVAIGGGCYVSTPEACFLQLAKDLDFIQLAKTGMELCGTYALGDHPSGFTVRSWGATPTTSKALASYLEKARSAGASSCKAAANAARFIATGSHSPAETNIFLLLSLPVRIGGYGIDPPLLNPALALTRAPNSALGRNARQRFRRGQRRPDFFWPKARLALEYESDLAHCGKERLSADSRRRGELELEGIHVLTLTREQLYNADRFDQMARTIIRLTGRRQRGFTQSQLRKRAALRREVLFDG